MPTITVNIDDQKDVDLLGEILNRFGLSYQVNTDQQFFSKEEIDGFSQTRKDFYEGKTTAWNWNEVEQDLNNAFR